MTKREKLLYKLLALNRRLEKYKETYAELDKITSELQKTGFRTAELEDNIITLIDNFAEKNVVFRPAGVRRFEIKVSKNERLENEKA